MAEYIDKDKTLEYIIFCVVGKDITCGELKNGIESLPSINVVHCRECQHWDREGHNCNIRDSYGWDYKADDYCSYGESEDE